MRAFLALAALAVILIMAVADAVWPSQPPLLIDAAASSQPGVWPRNAAGDWCDVKPAPPGRPRGKYEYRPGERPTDHGIA